MKIHDIAEELFFYEIRFWESEYPFGGTVDERIEFWKRFVKTELSE